MYGVKVLVRSITGTEHRLDDTGAVAFPFCRFSLPGPRNSCYHLQTLLMSFPSLRSHGATGAAIADTDRRGWTRESEDGHASRDG
ncbi:hypothetical protein J3F83DRAFT_745674 [Trichoderma novae-zelandiae]